MERKRPTISVPEAGRKYYGLGRNASYDAAKRGDIPTIKIGCRIFAIVAAIERQLGLLGDDQVSKSVREGTEKRPFPGTDRA